ncbi:phospholipase D family protein [Halomonas cerina]|uniref:Phosphatidylserine/phosphatidylglycerophosphate/ cardiolipin synthase-like enzyme n=1 Tax=Halomonas cerina TaxID=447424 RepID=A0A839V5C1_9GAMM|nr:phospholipase D-like domain-containing protein [Halomonas cerina]MBB3189210.1 phosphatidylserine/phosphatidylglycerophosphate/cardiolipin synthase-like enzyme [Halomonas cerina]
MPNMQQLRKKWFLDFSGNEWKPLQSRHSGCKISDWTSGHVVPVIEGKEYMEKWYRFMQDADQNTTVYHAGWRLEDVPLLGKSKPNTKVLSVIKAAFNRGVNVYISLSGHATNHPTNITSLMELKNTGLKTIGIDYRFPGTGSNHQKYTIFDFKNMDSMALLGSIDIDTKRWGRKQHKTEDSERPGYPTHEVGVLLKGNVINDLKWDYISRWNDETRTAPADRGVGLSPDPGLRFPDLANPRSSPPQISETPPSAAEGDGPQQIQVLRTFGIAEGEWGSYSWANMENGDSWEHTGEFTFWASFLNAIKNSTKYIYIEGQFFTQFSTTGVSSGENVWLNRLREYNPYYQLAQAIRRGVEVIVVVARNPDLQAILDERNKGIAYLRKVAKESQSRGDFSIAYLHNGDVVNGSEVTIYVHSKLAIFDDEFVLVGTGNVNQRSMTTDGEIHLGILDKRGEFAKDFRKSLWKEHDQDHNYHSNYSLEEDIRHFKFAINSEEIWRVRRYPDKEPPDTWYFHDLWEGFIVDPFHGPSKADAPYIRER